MHLTPKGFFKTESKYSKTNVYTPFFRRSAPCYEPLFTLLRWDLRNYLKRLVFGVLHRPQSTVSHKVEALQREPGMLFSDRRYVDGVIEAMIWPDNWDDR